MKIVLDARFYGLEHSGLGRYTINLINELARQDRKNKYVVLLRKMYFHRLKLPSNWKKVLADYRHYSPAEQVRLPKIISDQNPDLVHFFHFNVPINYKAKFVVTIHDMTMHRQGREATTLPLPVYYAKRVPYKYTFRKAVKSSEKIIVPSKAVKKDIIDYYRIDPDKVVVIYEGIEDKISKYATTTPSSRALAKYGLQPNNYFIYVGNAYPHKNLERAIEATTFINKSRKKKIIFVIISARNVFTNRLKGVIEKLGAKKQVKLLGFVPDEELGILLKGSIALVYPSLSEGFGLQGLESIATGTLVLASDIPVFREIYKKWALYFNPYDFSSIARVMEDGLDIGSKERERIIKKGQRFIERYSWSKMAKQTLRVYNSAARKIGS